MPKPSSGPDAHALQRLRTFSELFQYLVDELDWPLEAEFFHDDDLVALTYDWDPQELGVPAERVRDLRRLRQMRPLAVDQPWGVFVLEFSGSRLPVMQVRRLLRAFITTRRTGGDGTHPTWQLEDLLFFVITGGEAKLVDDSEFHLLAFQGDKPESAQFRWLGWRPRQSPLPHLNRLAEELLPCLTWPEDDGDVAGWRAAWGEAFKLTPGQPISDAARLADRMARTARDLRDQIRQSLEAENGSGPFTKLMAEIKTRLVSGVTADGFSDMCAQTLVYGMLSSRVISPEDFGSSPVFSTVPLANPFLEAFFEQIHDQAVHLDLPGSDLPQLAADLRETNIEAVLDQIGNTAKGGDPVIHFYEEFLKKYDRRMRADAGAFYTPQPAVEFIVRAVDEVLRSRFVLPSGIADPATWRETAQRNGFTVPEEVNPDKPFVSMIDPATGTGTFLVAWLRQARESFTNAGHRPDAWPDHLRDHVLPAMHGFELMLAPYAIAHLKAALELHTAGTQDTAMRILLTDTLEHTARQGQLHTMRDLIAEEGAKAAQLKENERFTIVIGNPPYDREQRSAGDTTKRKGGVIRHGAAGVDPLIKAVTEPMKAAGLGHHLVNVYNDYVYFWRWAVWQATELPPGPGVVAFITASSYLDGVSMGGVRHMLRQAFDELWIVDLGGEGRGARKEDNIFDIQTPVAIAIGVRIPELSESDTSGDCEPLEDRAKGCVVRYLRINGTRAKKLARLSATRLADVADEIPGKSLEVFTPRGDSQYYEWPLIADLFPWVHAGSKAHRLWPIAETKALLEKRWRALLKEVPRNRGILLRETRDRHIKSKPISLLSRKNRLKPLHSLDFDDSHEGIERYGYRSFDRQWIIADNRLADRPRPQLWQVRGPRQVFLTTLTSTVFGSGPVLTATPYVPDLHYFRGSYGAKDVMPLYRDPGAVTPNATARLLTTLSERLGIKIGPEDLLAYVYAIGGTAAFSRRFADELAEGAGPVRLPITTEPALFQQAVVLGRDLLWWHTWGERFGPDNRRRLPKGRAMQETPISGMPEDSKSFGYDSDSQTLTVGGGNFAPVSPEVWDFEVSGLQVLRSWLGYRMKKRKGRKSSPLDDIRPDRWTQTEELLLLLSILEHTVEVTPEAATLLDAILDNPLIPANELPTPTPAERKPPKL